MIKLTTPVQLPSPPARRLQHGDALISLGSCFSEHIGQHLANQGHNIAVNPFGAIYNPLSITTALRRLMSGTPYAPEDLIEYGGLWHSSEHHGKYSASSIKRCLYLINKDFHRASELFSQLRYLLITWGTAWISTDLEQGDGRIVSNCHKRPEQAFSRRRYSADELVEQVLPTLQALLEHNPELTIITSISPIRHLRDGAHGNQLSKATLLLMDEELRLQLGKHYNYYPAYEILLDELRDYRYYAEDLTHPSFIAQRIIQEGFTEWLACPKAQALGREVLKLQAECSHRPLHPEQNGALEREVRLRQRIEALKIQHPELILSHLQPL